MLEVPVHDLDRLWVRGGIPPSFLADDDQLSLGWRRDFIRTYLERDIPQLGPRIAAETLRRFWTMLAHSQAGLLNAASLARGLGVSGVTVASYLDLMVDLLLVRRLPPWHRNAGKRLVKSPKVYVRDTGLVHALLGLRDKEELLGHPVAGQTWESLVIETLIAVAPDGTEASFSHLRRCRDRPAARAAARPAVGHRGEAKLGAESGTRLPRGVRGLEARPADRGLSRDRALLAGARDRGGGRRRPGGRVAVGALAETDRNQKSARSASGSDRLSNTGVER